jgi:predicted metal-binding protein
LGGSYDLDLYNIQNRDEIENEFEIDKLQKALQVMTTMDKDLGSVLKDMQTIHPDLKLISTDLVVVAEWVRLKCRYGCRAYGKHLCCPPYAPTPEEMRKVISEYDSAVLAWFEVKPVMKLLPEHTHHAMWEPLARIHQTIYQLEREAFLSGFYKAFGLGALPCTLCESCIIQEKLDKNDTIHPLDVLKCRHKDLMRPSMEACGIDVFKTLENAGFNLTILKDYAKSLMLVGMVLLE